MKLSSNKTKLASPHNPSVCNVTHPAATKRLCHNFFINLAMKTTAGKEINHNKPTTRKFRMKFFARLSTSTAAMAVRPPTTKTAAWTKRRKTRRKPGKCSWSWNELNIDSYRRPHASKIKCNTAFPAIIIPPADRRRVLALTPSGNFLNKYPGERNAAVMLTKIRFVSGFSNAFLPSNPFAMAAAHLRLFWALVAHSSSSRRRRRTHHRH